MALKEYRVEGFKGIDQSKSENVLPSGYSPDAQNMDTADGDLAVAKGYVKHIDRAIPGTGKIRRMYLWRTSGANRIIVIAGNTIYYDNGSAWEEVYTYPVAITSDAWDFEEIRLGTVDHLIIANGQTQLVKWSGTGLAEVFGSGSYVYEGVVSTVTHNMTKATAASYAETSGIGIAKATTAVYAEASGVGTHTLTMPSGWAYVANVEIAFSVSAAVVSATSIKIAIGASTYTLSTMPGWQPGDTAVVKLTSTTTCEVSLSVYGITIGTHTLTMPAGWVYDAGSEIAFNVSSNVVSATSIKIAIGAVRYTANYVPSWTAGDIAVVKLTSATTCEISQTVYGINGVTLLTAIGADWKQRALDVGVQLKGVTVQISAINEARTVLTLESPYTTEIVAGDTAKVRGGVSDAAVNYQEIHFSRLFAAGDPEHPSRLYWSQPPGDTRTIEDWSADDASDVASGGFVDIGNTNSDPIVGLRSQSTQLIIFKETSIYRLLGDRPSNFRVTHVNLDVETMTNSGCVTYGDMPYWLTRAGMYYFNGQTAVLSAAARQIRNILSNADISNCKACVNRDRLYFTIKRGSGEYDDSIIVFDMTERTYMLRNGFNVIDICAKNGTMYLINENRYVCRFGEGDSYDGDPINAYWRTPLTDLSVKGKAKSFKALYLRGEGGNVLIDVTLGAVTQPLTKQMPEKTSEVIKVPLTNKGKTITAKIHNEAGSYFRLTGGIEIIYEEEAD